jgi:hypothetical protein
VPRLDYTNSTCPSILVEPQRTNLFLRSEEFNDAYWNKQSGASVTANTEIAPNGTTTADTINLVSGSTISRVEKASIAFSANTYLTISVYLKNISLTSGQTFQLRFETSGFDLRGTVDLFNNTNVVSVTGTVGTGYVSGTQNATITQLSNGWVRCSISIQSGSIVAGTGTFYLITNVDANRSFYAWGAQMEAGSNATSYIPTVASTVTRNADVISKTGISSLIGQTEGTIFVDFNYTKVTDVYRRIFAISDNTSNNLISINLTATGSAEIYIINGGVTQVAFVANTLTLNTRCKIAVGYIANNAVLYINGTLRNTDLSCTIPTCSGVYLGKVETAGSTGFLNDTINTAMLFKTKLTNSELATLTTL